MDLDPLKRKLVTRIIGVTDMVLGLGVLTFNLHTMWDYYLHDARKQPNLIVVDGKVFNMSQTEDTEDLDVVSEHLHYLKLPLFSIIVICLFVFGINLFQIFMGFALQVATFGRNQVASINIAKCWIRSSASLLFFVSLKLIVLGTATICDEIDAEWMTLSLSIIEITFRIFSLFWIPKFINFLRCQSDFDSRCYVFNL